MKETAHGGATLCIPFGLPPGCSLWREARMRFLLGTLILPFTLLFPHASQAGDLDLTKVSLHLKPHATDGCQSPPTVPCSQYKTNGSTGISYDAYLVVADAYYSGVLGVSCGISYDPAPQSGVDLYTWTLCADGFEWPNSGPNGVWPASGAGNRITWTTCQTHSISPNSIHAVAGVFYIYAYGADQLQVIENQNLDSGPELTVANCSGVESYLPKAYGARVDFSPDGTSPGYNPCLTQEPQCLTPETSIGLNYVPVGGYKDVSFSIVHGQGDNPLQGTITNNCPQYTIQSGGTYYLPYAYSSATVQVRVAPTAAGPLDCLLHLGSTCRDVRILGTATVTGHTLLSPSSILESVRTGSSRAFPVQIQDIGGAPLDWGTRLEFGTLQEIAQALSDNQSQVLAVIPNIVSEVVYAEGGGKTLSTDIGGAIFIPGRGGNSFNGSVGRLDVLAADFVEVNSFTVRASLKQHTGQEAVDRFIVHWNDVPYDVIVHRTFGHPDYASVNHMFILPDVNATFESDPTISRDDQTLSGLGRATRVYYLFFMGGGGRDYTPQETQQIAEAFLAAIHPYPQWATISGTAAVLDPGESSVFDLDLNAGNLEPGMYHANLVIPSNSLSSPASILPITLECTQGVTALEIDPGTLNPVAKGKWVNAYVELGLGSPADILLGTVRVLGTLSPDPGFFQVADSDSDGILDAHLRFDRTQFISALPPEDEVAIGIVGETSASYFFTATDNVRVLRPHVLYPHGGETLLAGTFVDTRFDLNETPDADSVVVAFSPNGGGSWQTVAETHGENHVSWRLPSEPGTENLVGVYAYRGGVLLGYDRSDAAFSISTATGIDPALPVQITALFQNHPNPFHVQTHIPFSMARAEEGSIEVFNVAGMRVRTLARGMLQVGAQEVSWDGKNDMGDRLPPGLYVVRLRTASKESSRRLFLVP
jgi:flagellar hook capping protein FlgD